MDGTGFEAETMSSIAFDAEGHCHVASVSGKVYVFDGTAVSKTIEAHPAKINAMTIIDNYLVTAAEDLKVIVREIGSYDIMYEVTCRDIPRSVDIMDKLLVVGDINSGITLYEEGKEIDRWEGHSDGSLWGLEGADKLFVTAGDDNKVILWDPEKHKALVTATIDENHGEKAENKLNTKSKIPDNQCARDISYNKKTNEVAIASANGQLHIRDLDKITEDKKVIEYSNRWSECMCYSPNGDMLAVGTYANEILVYNVPEYEQVLKLEGHKTPLICIDWSKDGSYLRTLEDGFELLFWNMPSGTQDSD